MKDARRGLDRWSGMTASPGIDHHPAAALLAGGEADPGSHLTADLEIMTAADTGEQGAGGVRADPRQRSSTVC